MILMPTEKYGERAEGVKPSLLIIHSTDMPTASSLEVLTRSSREVSCHYLIAPDGTVYSMVPEDKRAWHAGKSYWRGQTDINSLSIGIELVWPDDREAREDETPGPFWDKQMDALVALAKEIIARWSIKPEDVLAHSDIAPGRKRDPGERFDWKRLEAEGLVLLPKRPFPMPSTGDVTPLLKRYGYDTRDEKAAIIAFQRHFRQRDCSGIPDSETRSMLEWLLKKTGR
jgi:N-acetylmuramoyl-L-alanine amidase